ncbi:MAG: hypothetical protein QXN37_00565 [Candidatus Anstonellaceae archaeon]
MLISTSKSKLEICRKIASVLARAIPQAVYFGRGKRSIECLAKHATKRRFERLCIVSPYKIYFFGLNNSKVEAVGELSIKKALLVLRPKLPAAGSLRFCGQKSNLVHKLFGRIVCSEGESYCISATSKRFCLKKGRQKLLELEVDYGQKSCI